MDFSGTFLEATIFASDFNPFGQIKGLALIHPQIVGRAADTFVP
jgi:hypothetical protein